jgi:hypothetical protein
VWHRRRRTPRRMVQSEQALGHERPSVEPQMEGRPLLSLVHGIGFQSVLASAGWSSARQTTMATNRWTGDRIRTSDLSPNSADFVDNRCAREVQHAMYNEGAQQSANSE